MPKVVSMSPMTSCVGCGVRLPILDGVTHPYMDSSPACWAKFGEVLAREYSDPQYFAVHRLTVDAYAVQHPGRPSSQTVSSVALHLISLSLIFEEGAAPAQATAAMQAAARTRGRYTWLEPPPSLGTLTIADVVACQTAADHARVVREWALTVWKTWATHHVTVRSWVQLVNRPGR